MASNRIIREFKAITCDDLKNCGLKLYAENEDNLLDLRGVFPGPAGTPYEGGKFTVKFTIPVTYPIDPPEVRFVTRVWHPNVSSANGYICLDVLKRLWVPAMTLKTVLLSLQSLLECPNALDPVDSVVGGQFNDKYSMYVATAKTWTYKFAEGLKDSADPSMIEKINALVNELGLEEEKAIHKLSINSWEKESALESYFDE